MALWSKLYHGRTKLDFIGRTRLWFAISGVVLVIGFVALFGRGLNLGIDFEGGAVWELPAGERSVQDAVDFMAEEGVPEAKVQTLTTDDQIRLRIQSESLGLAEEQRIQSALATFGGVAVDEVSLNSVGPSWGDEITEKAVRALVIFLVVITAYVTLRFEFKMALATLAALVHDILVTVGVYALFGFEVTPATVIAILTILGYSIYDGIVVFDKVDENTRLVSSSTGVTYSDMVNLSLNQTLMRSLNTSITALLPILSLLVVGSFILGATTLEEFAVALLIGLASGAYSSIFIASPLLALLKEREPRFRDLRRRIEARSGGKGTPAAAIEGDDEDSGGSTSRIAAARRAKEATTAPAGTGTTVAPPAPSGAIPPRPRKKGRTR